MLILSRRMKRSDTIFFILENLSTLGRMRIRLKNNIKMKMKEIHVYFEIVKMKPNGSEGIKVVRRTQ
jgi:hypothetical protein